MKCRNTVVKMPLEFPTPHLPAFRESMLWFLWFLLYEFNHWICKAWFYCEATLLRIRQETAVMLNSILMRPVVMWKCSFSVFPCIIFCENQLQICIYVSVAYLYSQEQIFLYSHKFLIHRDSLQSFTIKKAINYRPLKHFKCSLDERQGAS